MLEVGKRYVRLVGAVEKIEDLAEGLRHAGITVVRDRDAVYVHHAGFDGEGDVDEAAGNLLGIIRGLYRLATGQSIELGSQESVVIDGKGHRTSYLVRTAQVKISASAHIVVTDKDGKTVREVKPTDPIPWWTQNTLGSESKRRAVMLYESQGESWSGLHKVFEVIEGEIGDVTSLDSTTKKQIKRFTQTANSYGAIGEDARHATDKIPSPAEPLSLSEARSMIEGLLARWLTRRAHQDAS